MREWTGLSAASGEAAAPLPDSVVMDLEWEPRRSLIGAVRDCRDPLAYILKSTRWHS